MERIEFNAMGTQVLAVVDRDEAQASRTLRHVPDWFKSWEQSLSRFRPDSELSKLNTSGVENPVEVSPILEAVLEAAVDALHLSGGLVTPFMLNEIEAAGYDRSFEQIIQENWGSKQAKAREVPGSSIEGWITFNRQKRTLSLVSGGGLDFGGVAKGWAADQAAARLKHIGPAMVDAGGDISVSGPMMDGSPWLIGVSDPFRPSERIDKIEIDQGGVATSGKDRRVWKKAGITYHHIIDPRTGKPANTDVLRATVIGPSARLAEMAAKVVVISGSYQGLDWLEARPDYAGMLVLDQGDIIYSRRWVYYSWR